MEKLTIEHLSRACSAGGASVLVSTTELEPAAGPLAGVAPARYLNGKNPTYVYETRPMDSEPVTAVLIDGKASTLNRLEGAVVLAMQESAGPLARTPRIEVQYEDGQVFTDLELPHRVFDGHVQAGTIDGMPTPQSEQYQTLRDSNQANARELLQAAPAALVLGGWDSRRKTNQSRFRSALTGEIIGVLADQSDSAQRNPKRGGSRVDPVASSVRLDPKQADSLIAGFDGSLSTKTEDSIRAEAKGKGAFVRGSKFGMGHVAPSLDGLGQVACSRIIRSFVLSFASLRQLRFGAGPDGDAAARALLAAWAINGMTRAQAELYIRANCDLVEKEPTVMWLDQRQGKKLALEPLSVEEADALLATALEQAERLADIKWEGQVLKVTGNPAVLQGASGDVEVDE